MIPKNIKKDMNEINENGLNNNQNINQERAAFLDDAMEIANKFQQYAESINADVTVFKDSVQEQKSVVILLSKTTKSFEATVENAKSIKVEAMLSQSSDDKIDKLITAVKEVPDRISEKVHRSMTKCNNEFRVDQRNDIEEIVEKTIKKHQNGIWVSNKNAYIYLFVLVIVFCLFLISFKSQIKTTDDLETIKFLIFALIFLLVAKLWDYLCSGWRKLTKK